MPEPTMDPSGAAARSVIFRHPLGYTFSHPATWRVELRAEGTLILPADHAVDSAGNALEMIALSSQAAPGIARPDDPQVLAFFEQHSAGMRRVGGAEPVASGFGPGIVLTFEGSLNGIDARRRFFVTLHNGEAIYLIHEASRALDDRRDSAVRDLFASLSYTRPASDPQIVGEWRRRINSGSTDSRGGLYTQEEETVAFHADGRLEFGKSITISGTTSGVSVFSPGNPDVRRGRYSAVNGQVTITWNDGGADRFEYALFMHEGARHVRIGPSGNGARFFHRVN